MRRRKASPDSIVEASRAGVTGVWRQIVRSVRAETGLDVRSAAWAAGIGGVALGLELARRWLERSEGRRQP